MKYKKAFLFFFIWGTMIAVFSDCSPRKNKKNAAYEKISFGTGGGIAGREKSHSIDRLGNLYSDWDQKKIKTLSPSQMKKIFLNADRAGLMEASLNEPGNLYYFIEAARNNKTNRIVWHDQKKAPDAIINLYNELSKLLNE